MIELKQLTKRRADTVVLDALNVTFVPGRLTVVVGQNGAGKTSMFRIMAGLEHQTEGAALICGRPMRATPEPLRFLGAMIDDPVVHPTWTVAGHLRVVGATHGIPIRKQDDVLEWCGLGGLASRRGRALSLGMRRRLSIAIALLGEPRCLVLDEPFNGLDPAGAQWLRGLLRSLSASGRTVVFSSHALHDIARFADDVVVLCGGRLVTAQTVDSLLTSLGAREVEVRCLAPEVLQTELQRRGLPAHRNGDSVFVGGVSTDFVSEIAGELAIRILELRHCEDRFEREVANLLAGSPAPRLAAMQ
ncbi:MAG: ABC transporter ATP-binding protein [Candidatus Nanopelagicales bacterium]